MLASFAGNIWGSSRICHLPDVKQLVSNLNDQLSQRNESDCIKGIEREFKKNTTTGYIYVHDGYLPQRATEDKLKLECLAYTAHHWIVQLVLWTWEELSPDLNSQNELAQKSVLGSFILFFFSCFAAFSVA